MSPPRMPALAFTLAWTLGVLSTLVPRPAAAVDEESCLDCHGYPGLSRTGPDGRARSFHIDDLAFADSAHANVRCGECHRDVQRIPHGKVGAPTCLGTCHLQEPSTGLPFSHAKLGERFAQSVHGSGGEHPEDLPTCTTCHRNNSIRPEFEFRSVQAGMAREVLSRCLDCHPQRQFAERFYAHFAARLRPRVRPLELVRMCTGCHEDEQRMARHGLEVTSTLRDSYHWKLVLLGDPDAPDCLSCHVPVGASVHDMRPKEDPSSAVHPANRRVTCANQGGVQRCHPGATAAFASGAVHASGAKAEIYAQLQDQLPGTRVEAALAEAATREVTRRIVVEQEVLDWVAILYKLLIAMTIGSMGGHQLLDLARRLRDRQRSRRQEG